VSKKNENRQEDPELEGLTTEKEENPEDESLGGTILMFRGPCVVRA